MTAQMTTNAANMIARGELALHTADVRAGLMATTAVGWDDPDLDTVADLLAVSGVAEPTAGERVAVAGRSTAINDTDNRVDVAAGTATFPIDTGQSAVGIFYYVEGASDALRNLISVHDFTSKSLDGGLTVDPQSDWLRQSV